MDGDGPKFEDFLDFDEFRTSMQNDQKTGSVAISNSLVARGKSAIRFPEGPGKGHLLVSGMQLSLRPTWQDCIH